MKYVAVFTPGMHGREWHYQYTILEIHHQYNYVKLIHISSLMPLHIDINDGVLFNNNSISKVDFYLMFSRTTFWLPVEGSPLCLSVFYQSSPCPFDLVLFFVLLRWKHPFWVANKKKISWNAESSLLDNHWKGFRDCNLLFLFRILLCCSFCGLLYQSQSKIWSFPVDFIISSLLPNSFFIFMFLYTIDSWKLEIKKPC